MAELTLQSSLDATETFRAHLSNTQDYTKTGQEFKKFTDNTIIRLGGLRPNDAYCNLQRRF
jgi:hypothetical protein